MAQFDLKNATLWIRDGYAGPSGIGTGHVNNVSGYPIGSVTMLVSGFTGPVVTGDMFLVAGDTVEHRITAHTETLGSTTSITFTPALTAAVIQNAAITWQPHTLEVELGEGNCSYTEKRNMEYKKSRGRLNTVREGDQEAVDVRLDAIWEFLRSSTGATVPTIEEALKGIGAAAGWISSASDPCEPYAVDIMIDYVPACVGVEKERITLEDYRWESLEHDAKAGTISTTGKCNITQATVVRYT